MMQSVQNDVRAATWTASQGVVDSLQAAFVDLSRCVSSAGFRQVANQICNLASRNDCPDRTKIAALECFRIEQRTTSLQESVTPLPDAVVTIALSGGPEVRRAAISVLNEWQISWRHLGPHVTALNRARTTLLMNSTPAA